MLTPVNPRVGSGKDYKIVKFVRITTINSKGVEGGRLSPLLSGFKRLCYSLCVFWLDLANTIGSLVSPKKCACGMAIFRLIVFYGVRIAPVTR